MGGNSYQDQYPNVFGITGKKGHGKDTFARLLLHRNNSDGVSAPLKVTHFAEELKRLAAKVYGLTHDQLHKLEAKEAPLANPIAMDDNLAELCRETGLNIQPAGCVAKSPRELMQFLGTEYVRKTQDNFWLDLVNKKITENGGHYLVPDTRFTNEAESIRSVGGKIIKIKRLDLPDADDVHASETEMESIDPDLFLGTVTDSFGLQTRVAEALLLGRFDIAQKYDYRSLQKGVTEYTMGANTREVAELLDLPLTEAEFILDYYKVLCTNCHGYRYLESNGSIWRGQITEELVACDLCNLNPESARYS